MSKLKNKKITMKKRGILSKLMAVAFSMILGFMLVISPVHAETSSKGLCADSNSIWNRLNGCTGLFTANGAIDFNTAAVWLGSLVVAGFVTYFALFGFIGKGLRKLGDSKLEGDEKKEAWMTMLGYFLAIVGTVMALPLINTAVTAVNPNARINFGVICSGYAPVVEGSDNKAWTPGKFNENGQCVTDDGRPIEQSV